MESEISPLASHAGSSHRCTTSRSDSSAPKEDRQHRRRKTKRKSRRRKRWSEMVSCTAQAQHSIIQDINIPFNPPNDPSNNNNPAQHLPPHPPIYPTPPPCNSGPGPTAASPVHHLRRSNPCPCFQAHLRHRHHCHRGAICMKHRPHTPGKERMKRFRSRLLYFPEFSFRLCERWMRPCVGSGRLDTGYDGISCTAIAQQRSSAHP